MDPQKLRPVRDAQERRTPEEREADKADMGGEEKSLADPMGYSRRTNVRCRPPTRLPTRAHDATRPARVLRRMCPSFGTLALCPTHYHRVYA